jgi:galactokinase
VNEIATNEIVARAPGRVNLIGDHTDYTGGLVMPFAIDRWTEVRGTRGGNRIVLSSGQRADLCDIALSVDDPRGVDPSWARYVAAVAAVVEPTTGFTGHLTSTVPTGSGLSSSAALELSVALALGCDVDPVAMAQLCRRAEHLATGTPTGIMDQLICAAGVDGHALMIDCHELTWTAVPVPSDIDVVIVHSGQEHAHSDSGYADRVKECAAAEAVIGPLRLATLADVEAIDDEVVRRRARHVVTENDRVRFAARALAAHDLTEVGELMVASHRSLSSDYAVSTSVVDGLVNQLVERDGVFGARMTGGGFGGCIVAICEPGALADVVDRTTALGREAWVVRPVAGASLI